mmetsp:Transcript_5255/g.21674  ORF Transcript_5255/g.21674 Transcript_5255/m.21674 type:complete len:271 (+) Transcript_5255:169-981(+)
MARRRLRGRSRRRRGGGLLLARRRRRRGRRVVFAEAFTLRGGDLNIQRRRGRRKLKPGRRGRRGVEVLAARCLLLLAGVLDEGGLEEVVEPAEHGARVVHEPRGDEGVVEELVRGGGREALGGVVGQRIRRQRAHDVVEAAHDRVLRVDLELLRRERLHLLARLLLRDDGHHAAHRTRHGVDDDRGRLGEFGRRRDRLDAVGELLREERPQDGDLVAVERRRVRLGRRRLVGGVLLLLLLLGVVVLGRLFLGVVVGRFVVVDVVVVVLEQ